jgi:NADPH:quinone reductase-like Zn-dependent oxidoreductase
VRWRRIDATDATRSAHSGVLQDAALEECAALMRAGKLTSPPIQEVPLADVVAALAKRAKGGEKKGQAKLLLRMT